VRDSAGVRVVNLEGALSDYVESRIDLEPLFRIGENGSGLDLFQVSAARFLPTGDLVIANAGVPELWFMDSGGQLVKRVGAQGEGPGEFGTLSSLHVQADTSLVVYDDRLARLTEFDLSGEMLANRRMTEANPISDLIPLAASQEGPVLAIYGDNRVFGGNGARQDSTPLLLFSGGSPKPDTLSTWPTKTWWFKQVSAGVARTQVPFSPDLLYAGKRDRGALATTHEPVISVVDGTGTLLMSVRWEEEGRPVTGDDFEAWQQDRFASLPEAIPEGTRREMVDVEPYGSHPVLEAIFLDADGSLWFAPTSLSSGSDRTWIRVSAEGLPLGSLTLPSSATLLDAADGRMAVLDRDELDVEVITVYGMGGP